MTGISDAEWADLFPADDEEEEENLSPSFGERNEV